MRFRAEIVADSITLYCDCEMTRDSVRTRILKESTLLAEFESKGGKVREFRQRWTPIEGITLHDVRLEYVPPASEADGRVWPVGAERMFLADANDCLFGTLLNSWLGPSNRRSQTIRRRISEGEFSADDDVDGHRCWVIRCKSSSDESQNHARYDQYWIDQERWLVRRWDTIETNEGTSAPIVRSRTYRNIRLVSPQLETRRLARETVTSQPAKTLEKK